MASLREKLTLRQREKIAREAPKVRWEEKPQEEEATLWTYVPTEAVERNEDGASAKEFRRGRAGRGRPAQ